MRSIKKIFRDMLKNKFSLRNFHASGENAESATKPYRVKIRQGAVKRLQPKGENCSRKEVFQRVLREFIPVLSCLVIVIGLGAIYKANAAEIFKIPSQLCGIFPCGQGNSGVEIAQGFIGKIVDNVRYIVGAVAVVIIVVSGIKLVFAGGNEEEFSKQMHTIIYGIIGLFFVVLAGDLAQVFEVDRGGFLKDPNVMVQKSRIFNRTVTIVITFIKYIIGSIAVIALVRNALRLVLMGGNEEEVNKDKKNILYTLLGLVLILISNTVVNNVFFKIDTSKYPGIEAVRPAVDPHQLALQIAGITNIVAAITGPFALLALVAGGLMYALSGGDEEKTGKAKKIIMWSLIGIALIYGAFAIVSTFISRQFEGI